MKDKFILFLPLLILSLVFWHWFMPGPRVATDFSLVSSSALKSQLNLPQTWWVGGTEGLGEYTAFTLWSWPTTFFQGLLVNLGFSFFYLERIIFIIPFLLIGGFGIWKLATYLELSAHAKIIATLFYLTNSYILLVIDGGQLTISLAYALFPLTFLELEKAVTGNFKRKIISGLLISGIGVFDIRFIYIFLILSALRFFYEFLFLPRRLWVDWIFKCLKSGLVITIIVLGLNTYWILVLIKYPFSSNFYQYLTQTSFTSLISLPHALFMLSPHWFKNIFGQITELRIEFILIPIFVFLAPILKTKNKNVGFWLLTALIAVFLTKGTAEPFPTVYQWLYINIPGFSLFRDSSKFFFLVALSYSILMGVTADAVIKKINSHKLKKVFIVIISLYFLLLSHPVWMGWMTGTFSKPPKELEYEKLNTLLRKDQRESNVFWIPTISPLVELNSQHPSVEAARLVQKRPFAQATVGTYELFNFLREAPYMGELFGIANIGYIAFPPLDTRRADPHPDNLEYYHTFLNQLSNLPWLSPVNDSQIPLLKVKKYQDKLFIPSTTWWVVGSDDIYKESTKSASLSLSNSALIFIEEFMGMAGRIDELPQSKIILNNKSEVDLAATFIDTEKVIFPAQYLKNDPDSSGWWKRGASDLIAWKDFLKTKYGIVNQDFDFGGGWAVAEGKLQLKIQSEKIKKDNILLIRMLESSRSGQVKIHQGDNSIGKIDTKLVKDNIRWFEVGSLVEDGEIILESEGDINVVNAIASLPNNLWQEYRQKAASLGSRIADFNEKNVATGSATVYFKQISPTKYELKMQNVTKPTLLVFSQNFDKNWKLNGQSPVQVYSLLNGFIVEKNGIYELSFEPQKLIPFTFAISFIVLITSIALLLFAI